MRRLIAARITLSALIGGALLSACAGGGGGAAPGPMISPPPPPVLPPPPPPPLPPPTTPPSPFPSAGSAEFLANWGPDFINAEAAWAAGYTGAGVTVGVIDDGIDPTHPELQGRVSPDSVDIVAGRNALTTSLSHGSELASLIAGNFNSAQTVGVAYGATILAVRADNGNESFNDNTLADALNYAVAHGVDIVNFSLGKSSPVSASFQTAIDNATANGVIIVMSAGNDGGSGATQVNYPAFLATNPAISRGLLLVAGGLNENGSINTISNPPGSAINWYLSAPGWQVVVPDHGPPGAVPGFQTCGAAAGLPSNLCEIQGTSYASPQVAGALALLREAFPGLTPAQLVDLALTSARDAGAPGVDPLYGRGIIDVARAMAPAGSLSMPTAAGGSVNLLAPVGVAGPAFGDAFANADAWRAAAFDAYGRRYDVSLATRWLQEAPRLASEVPPLWREANAQAFKASFAAMDDGAPDSLAARMPNNGRDALRIHAPLGAGFALDWSANAPPSSTSAWTSAPAYLGMAPAESALTLTRAFGEHVQLALLTQSGSADLGAFGASQRDATSLGLQWRGDATALSLAVGSLREQGSALGLAWDPVWGAQSDAETRFAGLSGQWRLGAEWSLSANAAFGATRLAANRWVSADGALVSTSAEAALRWALVPAAWRDRGVDGALELSLSQPLRIERGAMIATLPAADDYGIAHLRFEPRTISAVPSGREIDLRAAYLLWSTGALSARVEATRRFSPGHRADAAPADELSIGLRHRY
ncbi:MAG: S8 family serine peptidase [Alphaproteobacteria bacterium]|nr:S8 family serine peptidase [Alphaproteobacteria bacterium]